MKLSLKNAGEDILIETSCSHGLKIKSYKLDISCIAVFLQIYLRQVVTIIARTNQTKTYVTYISDLLHCEKKKLKILHIFSNLQPTWGPCVISLFIQYSQKICRPSDHPAEEVAPPSAKIQTRDGKGGSSGRDTHHYRPQHLSK